MKLWIQGQNKAVTLTQKDFLGQGGEGAVYVKGSVAYKIYTDPKRMLPTGKIQELRAITDPRVIRPEEILVDQAGVPLGYTMKFVKNTNPLCQIFTRAFREREGITHAQMTALVQQMQTAVENIHQAKILLVDLNEMNFLVSKDMKDVFFIDTDSYQTPHYPATAIMESIRDWSVDHHHWSDLSDWFSFAVVSFQMFTGIHPFKGKYGGPKAEYKAKLPTDPADDAFAVTRRRMQGNISVFHPDVGVPAAIYPFSVIPNHYLKWYEGVFTKGLRSCPPDFSGRQTVFIVATPIAPKTSQTLTITLLREVMGTIRAFADSGTDLTVISDEGVWLGAARVPLSMASSPSVMGVSPLGRRTVLGAVIDEKLALENITDRTPVSFDLAVREACSSAGHIYVRTIDQVHEVVLSDMGSTVVATSRPVVNILEHASQLFPGVVVQNMLGAMFVSLLSGGAAHQIRMPELDGYRIVEAVFDKAHATENAANLSGVLMVVGEKKGLYDRLVIRFDEDVSYDIRKVADINPSGLNFVVLDSGTCVCLTENDELELFSCRKGATSVKKLTDPAITGDMTLGKRGGTLLASRGNKVYSLQMR